MLRLGSPSHHNIAEWVGKQRQDPSIPVSYSKQQVGWGQKLTNSPQYYSTVVYDLSRNTRINENHQLSLLPIGRSQIVRQKPSKTFNPTLQYLPNDFDKTDGRSNIIANKTCAYTKNNSCEYVRNNSNRKYPLNNIIKQRKADEVNKNDPLGQTRANLYVKKEVSFISITKTDGNFPKRPWHNPNFYAKQNGVIAITKCNKQPEESLRGTTSAKITPNGLLQNQRCSIIKNLDDTKGMQTYPEIVSPKKTTPLEKSSVEPFFVKFPTSSLTKPHCTKLHDSTPEQSIQVSQTANCCSQPNTEVEKTAQAAGERLTCHLEKTPSIETQQKYRKILKPAPPNNRIPVHSARVMTKLLQNRLDEKNSSDTKGSEVQKVINQTFQLQKFENTLSNAKIKTSLPNSSLSSKIKQESKSFKKNNSFSTEIPETRDCSHPTPRKSELEQFSFNPMHTAQISRFSRSQSEEDCENDKNNGVLSLNSKNLSLFEIFTSKTSSKLDSKNRRVYKWLEDCQRHSREILFKELEAKINNS